MATISKKKTSPSSKDINVLNAKTALGTSEREDLESVLSVIDEKVNELETERLLKTFTNTPDYSSDPLSPVSKQVYYSTSEKRYKFYDGENWRPLGGSSGIAQATYLDSASTTKPSATPYSPDGTAISNGDFVLFTNLSSGNNQLYKASVSGSTITWSVEIFGQSPTGVPTTGDGVYIKEGTKADDLYFYDGSFWFSLNTKIQTLASTKVLGDAGITNTELSRLSGISSSVQNQLNAKEPTLTKGNLTATSPILVTGGTGSVIGSGVSFSMPEADRMTNGYLSYPYWTKFNKKLNPSLLFGSGIDGDLSASSGTITLARDMYYNNVTLSGTAVIKTAGYRMFVAGTLDLTNATQGAIQNNGPNGGNGGNGSSNTGGTAGAAASALAATIVGGGGTGPAGKVGSTASLVGTAGTTGVVAATPSNGGRGGAGGSGASGTGAGGAGAAGGTQVAASTLFLISRYSDELVKNSSIIGGGSSGSSGGTGGGGGSTSAASGGSGGGGTGGGVLYLAAATLARGASTSAGVIQAKGGAGGSAGTSYGLSSSAGGSGGGGGGGGGWVYFIVGELTGSAASNILDASGGNGGAGGTGGTGGGSSAAGGAGGNGGDGGRITLINLEAQSVSEYVGTSGASGGAGGAAVGLTPGAGGSGGAGNSLQVSL